MSVNLQVTETIFAFTIGVMIGVLLRKFSIISETDGKTFTKLLTNVILPAVIFLQLSSVSIGSQQILLIVAMIVSGLLSMFLARIAGFFLKLSRPETVALMLTFSFGSSALLGYPLIAFSFPDNPEAMADAVLLSELGVGLPIFLFGPAIAIYFGDKSAKASLKQSISFSYFYSPIFLAVFSGIIVSLIPFDRSNYFIAPFFEALKMINGSVVIMASLILSLQLKLKSLKGLLPLFIISALIQMVIQPFMAHTQALLYHLPPIQSQVLVLISSMPSAVLGPVFANHYDCAPETASSLVMAHIILSIVFIPMIFYLMARLFLIFWIINQRNANKG